jgi:translocation and assembly module TamB
MLGSRRPIELRKASLESSKLSLTMKGVVSGGETKLQGSGKQVNYGAFTFDASFPKDGPHANFLFDSPLPAAGLKQVNVALTPSADGFAIDTDGQSLLGPFKGALQLSLPTGGPVGVTVKSFNVSDTDLTGKVTIANGAASGTLAVAHGGLNGTIALAPRNGGQGLDVDLKARNASFGSATQLTIQRASITAKGTLGGGQSAFSGQASGQGVSFGRLFVGRFTAQAEASGGKTTFDAALAGQRGSGFELQLTGSANSQQIAVAANGSYDSQAITMPRRAVLAKLPDGGWELRPTQIYYGDGTLVAEGRIGGGAPATGKLSLAKMPLSLIDAVGGNVGLGGTISGVVDLSADPNGTPTGEAKVMVKGLTRSGLLLTSRPIDLALVSRLSPTSLQARAVLQDSGDTKGRLQGRIAMLTAGGSLFERLQDGDLQGQLRYEGPAGSLWRLAAVNAIDLQGPIRVTADVRGSLRSPDVEGTIAGDDLRVQSALTGTDVQKVRARGRFSGSLLQLTSFSGTGPSGGKVSGSGTVDLSNMAAGRGPALDLRLAAKNARILDLPTMGATVTGPIRIVSSGVGGTIAGRLKVDSARWRLGAASATEQLPDIKTKEINVPADVAPVRRPGTPWRYLIDAVAPGQVKVDGMGLDSEWSANIRLRGTTADPRIGGSATIVPRQGFYSFAGTRFDITRGRIDFDEDAPPDPRIDLEAQTTANGLSVTVSVTGRAARPEIAFSSTPSLPEEEILSRLLFGGSISNLSATDALQLGAALASLRGGSGIDPINKLRQAVGLDRLRIVPADPALNRGTALALGKRFGHRFYGEVITDGRGYSATNVEFRITSWLALLGTVSSLGRESATLEYSKDY